MNPEYSSGKEIVENKENHGTSSKQLPKGNDKVTEESEYESKPNEHTAGDRDTLNRIVRLLVIK